MPENNAPVPSGPNRFKRIVYVTGPGNVFGTYDYWRRGLDDPTQISITYPSLFFDLCREFDMHALVLVTHQSMEVAGDGRIRIERRRVHWADRGGLRYHAGQIWYVLGIVGSAIRFRSDVVLVANISHWYVLSLLRLFGIAVIPSLHCALWPVLNRPNRVVPRLNLKLNGWFWRRAASATVCVSPECERQVREIARTPSGPIYQSRANYHRHEFVALPDPRFDASSPFRVMFAGRLERYKGVFDIVATAAELERTHPGRVQWIICGSGGAEAELRSAVESAGLVGTVQLVGYLTRDAMLANLARAHAVIVPTTKDFAEGLNKVAVESVLAGRPLVTTVFSNAGDLLGEAAIEVTAGDVGAYADAIRRLATEPDFFAARRRACLSVREQFFDADRSWGAMLKRALSDLSAARCPEANRPSTDGYPSSSAEDSQEVETPSHFENSSAAR